MGRSFRGLGWGSGIPPYPLFYICEVRNIVNNDFSVQELGKVELHQTGIDRLLSLVNLDPTNEKAYFNLGMITMDEVGNIVAFTPPLPSFPSPLPVILPSVSEANCQLFK